MGEATYTVKVAWEPLPSTAFVLDSSVLNGPKVLTNQYSDSLDTFIFGSSKFDSTQVFGGAFDALYSDVSSVVRSVSIRRGRDDNLSSFGAGEAVIVLQDTTARFSPLNASSPLAPNVVPGRPVVVNATYGGTAYGGQFKGFVRSIEYDPLAQQTTIHAQDLFLYLSRAKPTITNTGTVTTGAAVGTVLTAIDWTEAQYRSLQTGDTINSGFSNRGTAVGDSADGSTALQLIEGFLETSRGEFFQSRGGTVTFRDRYDRYKRTSAGTITNAAANAVAATDLTNIKNRAKVVKTGSGTAVWTDYVSANNYGYSDYPAIDSAYINTAAQGTALAQWLVSQTKDPSPPVRSLKFTANRDDTLMVTALSRDLGDRITVADTAISGTADFYIEGIEHAIHSGGKVHEVSYSLSKVPTAGAFIFGTSSIYPGSKFDGADVFVY